MDCRRHEEDLTEEELNDLKQFEEGEKHRFKAENRPDREDGEETMLSKREKSMSLKVVKEPCQTPQEPSPPSTNDDPHHEEEHDDLLDLQDAGE
jgi:hypothetical protein